MEGGEVQEEERKTTERRRAREAQKRTGAVFRTKNRNMAAAAAALSTRTPSGPTFIRREERHQVDTRTCLLAPEPEPPRVRPPATRH